MKKTISVLMMLVLLLGLAVPVYAQDFVPSISYKDNPDVVGDVELVDPEGNVLEKLDSECLEITPVSEAAAKKPEDRSESDQLLVDVYNQLLSGEMKLPFDEDKAGDMVIRDLIDASLICGDVHTNPSHVEELAKTGVCIRITFDLGVKADTEVTVMAYVDGQWVKAERVVNNGDGTVTCIFEQICPIAFSVEEGAEEDVPTTGDTQGRFLLLWVLLLVVSFGAMLVLLLKGHKLKLKKRHR